MVFVHCPAAVGFMVLMVWDILAVYSFIMYPVSGLMADKLKIEYILLAILFFTILTITWNYLVYKITAGSW